MSAYINVKGINENCDAFSLVEVVVSFGLIVIATVAATFVMLQCAAVQVRNAKESRVAENTENLVENIRATLAYNGNLYESVQKNGLPKNISLKDPTSGEITLCEISPASVIKPAVVTCTSSTGAIAQRLLIIAAAAPLPGSVLTPAPTDIIRMQVATPPPIISSTQGL